MGSYVKHYMCIHVRTHVCTDCHISACFQLPIVEYGTEAFNLSGLNKEHLEIPPRRFPTLSENQMEKFMNNASETLSVNSSEDANFR